MVEILYLEQARHAINVHRGPVHLVVDLAVFEGGAGRSRVLLENQQNNKSHVFFNMFIMFFNALRWLTCH